MVPLLSEQVIVQIEQPSEMRAPLAVDSAAAGRTSRQILCCPWGPWRGA
jgi:hypothetical protein